MSAHQSCKRMMMRLRWRWSCYDCSYLCAIRSAVEVRECQQYSPQAHSGQQETRTWAAFRLEVREWREEE